MSARVTARSSIVLLFMRSDSKAQLRPVFGEAIARTMNLLTIRPDSDERVTLPFKVENTRPRPDLEKQMLDLVNQERQAAGLSPLAARSGVNGSCATTFDRHVCAWLLRARYAGRTLAI